MSRLPDYLEQRAAILEDALPNQTAVDGAMDRVQQELRTLASEVDGHLSKLEIKLALDRIVTQLGMVRQLLQAFLFAT